MTTCQAYELTGAPCGAVAPIYDPEHRRFVCRDHAPVAGLLTGPHATASADWRAELRRDLELLDARAQHALQTTNDPSDHAFAAAAQRLIQRITEFEDLRPTPP